ncbi:type II toxin-antitoxin system HicB family antitoxin [bacterium]|nr:type II toxin-antitoxin system HicB family antitoxin [bacterium]
MEDYLAFCKQRGGSPDQPFSGKIALRIPPELHRRVSTEARRADKSLNKWVQEALERAAGRGRQFRFVALVRMHLSFRPKGEIFCLALEPR